MNINGTNKNDTLSGAAENDLILGLEGNDSLSGSAGNDTLEGAVGNDTLNGGIGNDTLIGGAGNDLVVGDAGNDSLDGGEGSDIYLVTEAGHKTSAEVYDSGATGLDELRFAATVADTSLLVSAADSGLEIITIGTGTAASALRTATTRLHVDASAALNGLTIGGNAGDNSILGGQGFDALLGEAGQDSLFGGEGKDTLNGGAGNDSLDGGSDADSLSGGSDQDTLLGGAGNDTLDGGAGNDSLDGGNDNDSLIGGDGNDTLTGDAGVGIDTLAGGAGNDVYLITDAQDVLVEALNAGTDTVRSSVSYTLLANFEQLELIGTATTGTGNALANTLTGNALANTLDGGSQNDTLIGGEGDDVYVVDSINDRVIEQLGQGADTIRASVSFSLFDTHGAGSNGGNVEHLTLTGTAAINATGNALDNSLTGNTGNNLMDGGAGNDTLIAGDGNDTLIGGAGNDTLQGGIGNDLYLIANASEKTQAEIQDSAGSADELRFTSTVAGGTLLLNAGDSGIDRVVIGTGTAALAVTTGTTALHVDASLYAQSLTLIGNNGSNGLTGGTADDTLNGGAGNDSLFGGNGSDVLDGGDGIDNMTGGAGNDTYVLNLATDRVLELADGGVDTIRTALLTSFDLSNVTANGAGITAVEHLTYTGSAKFTGIGNDLDNSLSGGSAGDSLVGGAGNDTLNGGAGNDTMSGGSGDDVYDYTLGDTIFESADGGIDTLRISTGTLLDLSKVTASNISQIEHIEIASTANLKLMLSGAAVNAISSTIADSKVLTMHGDAGDALHLTDAGWKFASATNESGQDYFIYTKTEGSTPLSLKVDADIQVIANLPELNLGALSGSNGFQISGVAAGDLAGISVSNAGDINGDGFDDVIVGASKAEGNKGAAYVVYGKADGFGSNLDLSTLDASQGFKIAGLASGDATGFSVSNAGDVNGDGLADLIIGSYGASSKTGVSYVLFGKNSGFGLSQNLSSLNGSNGFKINGTGVGQEFGKSVSAAGDFNADGFDDLLIGLPGAAGNVGGTYVIYGKASFSTTINLTGLDTNSGRGFSATGGIAGDFFGGAVSTAGDLNLDGFADILVGAHGTDASSIADSGITHILFGVPNASGLGGSSVSGLAASDAQGRSVSAAGDLNGDGYDDVILGAYKADANGNADSGASYVIFGSPSGIAANNLSLLNGGNGFKISGAAAGDLSGFSVSSAGDVNGDGYDDLLIGADSTNANGDETGTAYVVYGKASGFANNLDLSTLNGSDGFKINGEAAGDRFGISVSSAGDMNGDGYDDLIVGAHLANAGGTDNGASYVLFGQNFNGKTTHQGLSGNDTLTGATGNDVMVGGLGNDSLVGAAGRDALSGGAGDDTLDGGAGDDILDGGGGNDVYLVDSAKDVIKEDAAGGNDTVRTSLASFNLVLHADVENLAYTGTANFSGRGNGNSNQLSSGRGNDTLDGGTGNDTMTGGAGNDLYIVHQAGDVVVEEDSAGIDTIRTNQTGLGLTRSDFANVENLIYTESTGSRITGNALNNSLSSTNTSVNTNDTLDGGAGIDSLSGGFGNDTYIVDLTATGGLQDTVTENASAGTDTLQLRGIATLAKPVTLSLSTNLEHLDAKDTGSTLLHLTGNASANKLTGNDADNSIDGGAGIDTLVGGKGNDIYVVDHAGDVVTEDNTSAGGVDTIKTSLASYILSTGVEHLLYTGTAAFTAAGNALDNSISGGALNDQLTGGDGNDTLDGGAGNDTLIGGIGNDTYVVDKLTDVITENNGEGTADTVLSSITFSLVDTDGTGSNGGNVENLTLTGTASIHATGNALNNGLTGNVGGNSLNGGDGNDTLDGAAGKDTMTGGAGNDVYVVDNAADILIELVDGGTDTVQSSVTFSLVDTDGAGSNGGNVENLSLTGSANTNATGNVLNNLLTGNSGNNSLDGGLGNDTLVGGAGNDTYVVDTTTDILTEQADGGVDTVLSSVTFSLADTDGAGSNGGNIENLTLTSTANSHATGNGLDNVLTGNSGNNSLDGGAGNDTLDGGLGNDTMTGGAGNDLYLLNAAGDEVVEAADAGVDTIKTSVLTTLDLTSVALQYVENLVYTGSAKFTATGNALDNSISGGSAGDSLAGGAGNDTLDGGLGNDTLIGGTGDDVYVINSAADRVLEANGTTDGIDTIRTSLASFDLNSTVAGGTGVLHVEHLIYTGTAAFSGAGNAADNSLIGGIGADKLTGKDGNDTLDGGAGKDTMTGGTGNDVYVVDNTAEILIELNNEGTDTVLSSVTFSLADTDGAGTNGGNIEHLTLTGSANTNATGNTLNNVLTGNSGNNSLDGGLGNDTLIGGAGNDTLTGGAGDDSYSVDSADDVITESANAGEDTVESSVSYTLGNHLEHLKLTGTSDTTATGNALNNMLVGNSGNNTLEGGAGNDTLAGGEGNDLYIVDSITDIISEATDAGIDTVQSSVSFNLSDTDDSGELGGNIENLVLTASGNIDGTGNALDNHITGNAGENRIDGDAGSDTMTGGAGNDIYIVDNATDSVIELNDEGVDTVLSGVTFSLVDTDGAGSNGGNVEHLTLTGSVNINGTGNALNNVLTGNTGNNILDGGAGNDTLTGGAGIDTLIGGAGDDTYLVDSDTDTLTELAELADGGIDIVLSSVSFSLADTDGAGSNGGNIENLTLTGNDNISATGNALNNRLIGNSGNNTLDGGAGIDTLIGGAGDDTYLVDSNTDTLTELAELVDGGIDTVLSSVSFSLVDTDGAGGDGGNIENLTLTGNDNIIATGNALNNQLIGNSGNNTLDGGAGIDTLIGGAGDDTYLVDNDTDILTELVDNGIDTVLSSVSFNLADTDAAGSDGGNIENLILTGSANTNATGNSLNNILTGNSGNNSLDGGAGNDTLEGASGLDTLNGGAGDDIFMVDSTTDILTELAEGGTDTVLSSVTFSLADTDGAGSNGGNIEHLTLTGSANTNATGNTLNNVLTGNTGNNSLAGGEGNDTLNGGTGIDTLSGGTGNDVYVYQDDVTVTEVAGQGQDTLMLSGADQVANLVDASAAEFSNLEIIDITGTGNNILTIDSTGIDNISESNTLTVRGNAGDLLVVIDNNGWTSLGAVTLDGQEYQQYAKNDLTLIVDSDIDQSTITAANSVSATLELASLNSSNGFKLSGVAASDYAGRSVSSAGDINGDGFDDLIIGALGADPNGTESGAAYVMFGKATGFGPNLQISTLNGSNGFKLSGISAGDHAGQSVSSAGDINGDGFDDLLLGADAAADGAGHSYVVFGKATGFSANLNLSSLNGSNGFKIVGNSYDYSGFSVSNLGDTNGDGFDDIAVGAFFADFSYGATYVVFGKSGGFGNGSGTLNLTGISGTNGYKISGAGFNDFSGRSVGNAGDINGDGLNDILIGATGADTGAGAAYVLFGKAGTGSPVNLSALNGTNGFKLQGGAADDFNGISVSGGGDINGDGLDDLVIGASGNDAAGAEAGRAYVLFGKASGFSATVDLNALNGSNGFAIHGAVGSFSGRSVSIAGDVNGDGLDDLLIGATGASNGSGLSTGAAYIVFGQAGGFAANFDLSSVNGYNGFKLEGISADDDTGISVKGAGDINGDGYDDLIVGADEADPNGSQSGAGFVVFGRDSSNISPYEGTSNHDNFNGTVGNDIMVSGLGNDTLRGADGQDALSAGAGNDSLYGGAGNDILKGGAGDDVFVFDTALAADNIDRIRDFEASHGLTSNDLIALDQTVFSALTSTGALAAGQFVQGLSALDANDFILYDKATGSLYYDADGNGAGAAIKFATLSGSPDISATDFIVIS